MRILRAAAVVALMGCASNPYAQFYQGAPDARLTPGVVTPTGGPAIYSSSDLDRDVREVSRRSFALVGQSAFNADMNRVKLSDLQAHAVKVGASMVLVASRYTSTLQGVTPLTLPTTSTTTSSGTAQVSGSAGSVTVTGTGTSTTTGSRTLMMPYTVNRGDFTALYFVKVRPRIGIFALPLDDATRRQLETNSGIRVDIVMEGSPAFDADILPGDIVLSINMTRIRSPEHFAELARQTPPGDAEVQIVRGNRPLTKRLTILAP